MECKKTLCRICSYGCMTDAWVENGVIRRLAPDRETPGTRSFLCAKGYAGRQYVYNRDRILTPLRRVGKRGEGLFEPISWEEALREAAQGLNRVREQYGPESVFFYSGYTKWYRWLLHRLAYSFGSPNYGTESSSCFKARIIAARCSSGLFTTPDLKNTDVVLAWGYNPDYSNLPGPKLETAKDHGAAVVIIDPKLTPAAARLADVHLRPVPGTDGALALGFGRYIIHSGLADDAFIARSVTGYSQYCAAVESYTPKKVSELTGIPEGDFLAACSLLHRGTLSVMNGNAGIIHHRGGVQNFRAIDALVAITGGFVKKGGNFYSEATDPAAATPWLSDEFVDEVRPQNVRPKLGSKKYPVWSACIDECQAMELPDAVLRSDPYPVRAVLGVGMNARLFPENEEVFRALEQLDLFVDVDLFMNDTARYADIILPACTSMERRELTCVGSTAIWRDPAIAPLGQSRSDGDILCDIARALELNDPVLTAGYDECCRYVLREMPFTLEELQKQGTISCPQKQGGRELRFSTPSGKYELSASLLTQNGYEGLPLYHAPTERQTAADSHSPAPIPRESAFDETLPFLMCSGGRLPGAFASRFHRVEWTRQTLRPHAAVDIHPEDAAALGFQKGDTAELYTHVGTIRVRVNPTYMCLRGVLHLYHGYSEADVNSILPKNWNDPISGFPGYRSFRCGIRKVKKGEQDHVSV